jgi:hypothetical protein
MALLMMYLKRMGRVLELIIRFLNSNPDWLVKLNLKRKIDGKLCYKVPDRSVFSKFAKRLGLENSPNLLHHGLQSHELEDNQRKEARCRF